MKILTYLRSLFTKKPKPLNPGDYDWGFKFVRGGFCELKSLRTPVSRGYEVPGYGIPPLSDKGESAKYFKENGISVDYGVCEHDMCDDPLYSAYWPSPRECSKCGYYDANGFTGEKPF